MQLNNANWRKVIYVKNIYIKSGSSFTTFERLTSLWFRSIIYMEFAATLGT